MMNALTTIIIGIAIQYYSIKSDDRIVNQAEYSRQYYSLVATIQNTPITSDYYTDLASQLKIAEIALINEGDMILENFLTMTWVHFILSSYFLQNIFQYISARLRNKSVRIIIPEFLLNCLCTLITLYIIIMHYFNYRYIELQPEEEKFRSSFIMYRASGDKHFRVQILFAILTSAQWIRVFFYF